MPRPCRHRAPTRSDRGPLTGRSVTRNQPALPASSGNASLRSCLMPGATLSRGLSSQGLPSMGHATGPSCCRPDPGPELPGGCPGPQSLLPGDPHCSRGNRVGRGWVVPEAGCARQGPKTGPALSTPGPGALWDAQVCERDPLPSRDEAAIPAQVTPKLGGAPTRMELPEQSVCPARHRGGCRKGLHSPAGPRTGETGSRPAGQGARRSGPGPHPAASRR